MRIVCPDFVVFILYYRAISTRRRSDINFRVSEWVSDGVTTHSIELQFVWTDDRTYTQQIGLLNYNLIECEVASKQQSRDRHQETENIAAAAIEFDLWI